MAEMRKPREIATVIRNDWKKPYFGAVPYIDAMSNMSSFNESYGWDSAHSIISYFLANAATWRGPVAREIKKELNSILKQL